MKTLAPTLLLLLTATAAADPGTEVRAPARLLTIASLPPPPVVATHDGEPLAAEPRAEEERPRTIFGLPKNVGTGDRVLRTFVGAALLGTGIWGLAGGDLSSTTSGILMGVSAIPLATAATGYCPVYQLLGIDHTF